MFRLFECCALSFFERFVLSFSLKIERFVSDSAEIWICGLYIEEKTDKKGKNFLQFSAFSAEKVNDGFEYLWVRFLGFDRKREEWLQPQTGIEAKGELELSVYNDKLNIACKVSEMSEYVKQPYNPNN